MNCLGSCKGRYEFNLTETSAPPYYPPQLPYNPDFVDENGEYDASIAFDPSVMWNGYYGEYYAGNNFENYDEWGRARHSLYEGVNCMPVSALACVHRIARCLQLLPTPCCGVLCVHKQYVVYFKISC